MEYEIKTKKLYSKYSPVRWAEGEPYWVSNASYSAPAKPIEKLHYHNMYEMGICVEGSGEFQINDRLYRFGKGDIVFVNHYTPHFSNSDHGYPAKWRVVFFDPIKLMQLAGMLDPDKALMAANVDISFSGVFSPDENPNLTNFINNIIKQSEIKDEYTDISLAFSIGSFIIACTRYAKTHPVDAKPMMINRQHYHKIAPAIAIINSHMGNSSMISEDALARICKMSVPNLRKLFIKYTGLSPKVYINHTRMAYAEYLLSNTDMTILKIANEVGYSEVSGFNRIFKATFGMSPSEYRKQNQG
ncbi:MAG: helix-turn-helix transcriptional regulator [Clostridia bacterium]|nr:helix-turn-helix transcriptional regulator [Clostridia bacterium]